MHPVERFLELTRASELWQEVPLIYRSPIVAILRRDLARSLRVLRALADLLRQAEEDSHA